MRLRLLSIFVVLLFLQSCCKEKDFVWYDGSGPVTYSISLGDNSKVARVALDMFAGDMTLVTGLRAQSALREDAKIYIIQLNAGYLSPDEISSLGIPDSLAGKKDAFFITVRGKGDKRQLLVVGSDDRGTAYGILELSRIAGVSPWIWWGDVVPDKKELLSVPSDFTTFQSPSVEYRGIFLNDEDWTLQPWSWKHFDPSETKGMISSRTYKEIFKLLMRLRANAIWPGMHGVTVPFYMVPGAKEAADSCGIAIGTSHCEPLLRNNVGEWDVKKRGNYDFINNRRSVLDYWTERLNEAGKFENMYTIGMRGIHDESMEGVNTLEEKTAALQIVIEEQRKLLAQYVNPDLSKVSQVFVPYKEVLQIMENGLEVPEDVTLMWCDDNYGYLTRLSDAEQQKRSGGAGVYHHLSYWGRPHDYLWLTTTQPGLVYSEMKQAYDHNARKVWITNVHDMKPAAYDLELFLDMAWNINSLSPSTLNAHLEKWLCREFGDKAGEKLLPEMLELYRLCGIRKPEFMGWSQVEVGGDGTPKGWSQVNDTEFSFTEFGSEADRYIASYKSLANNVKEIGKLVPAHRKDAFFGQVEYMVYASAAMSEKMLEAQRARALAAETSLTDKSSPDKNPALIEACARSIDAYNEIIRLTNYYNNEMSGGKWKYSMCYNTRDLPVFDPPKLPLTILENRTANYSVTASREVKPLKDVVDGCIAVNACDYTAAGNGATPVQMLGHSMNAVVLPKGESLTYEFDFAWEGDAVLRTALIPTQPNDKGDLRFSVSIDGGEPQVCTIKEGFRTEEWKRNVLRGQAIRETKHNLSAGKHTLVITALDNHIVIDQWMLDTDPLRKFYVFPVVAP